jgi:hypothetical protein
MLTNHAQEREAEVVRGNETHRKPRWRHHKYITNEDGLHSQNTNAEYQRNTLRNKETDAEDFHAILFLQEVVKKDFRYMTGYAAHKNIGTEERAAVIMTRDTTERAATEKLPRW